MPDTIGGYWGTKQFARDLPLAVVRATSSGSTFGDDLALTPPPHEAEDTLLIVLVMRFDMTAVLTSIPSGLTEVFNYENSAVPTDDDWTHLIVYRKEVVTPDYTTMHFIKATTPPPTGEGSFINVSIHSVIGAGPIENMVHSIPAYPHSIPAITTTKPNCLLVLAYTARYGYDQFIPEPPAAPEWEGIGAAYISSHWNAYERNALVEGTYGPTSFSYLTTPDTYINQYLVMQVNPKPAAPTPDLTLTLLSPASGVLAGGTTVTVTGTSFAVGATSVTIGATTIPAGSVTVLTGTSLTFVTPAGPGGVKSVQAVSVTVGAYTSNQLSYTYNPTGSFSPASIPHLQCWLDDSEPSTVSLSGSQVTQHRDLSIHRYLFNTTASTALTYPADIGGLNVMTWNAGLLRSTVNMPGERPRTFCWVMDPNPSTQYGIFCVAGGNTAIGTTATGTIYINCNIPGHINPDTGVSGAGLHVWVVTLNATESHMWKDGTLVWSSNPGSLLSPGDLIIGANSFSTNRFVGVIPEICVYPSTLTTGQRTALETYLTGKWMGFRASNALHGHTADNIVLVVTLTVANGVHAHAAENAVLNVPGAPVNLVVANGAHAHTADNITLTVGGGGGVLASDDFNRANGAPGSNWTENTVGSWLITSNQLVRQGSGNERIVWATAMSGNDYYVQAKIYNIGNKYLGPMARCSGASGDMYEFYWSPEGGGSWRIGKQYFGFTLLANLSETAPADGVLMRFEVEGTSLRGYANGVLKVSATDSSIPTGTVAGLISAFGGGTFDDFEAGTLGPAGPVNLVVANALHAHTAGNLDLVFIVHNALHAHTADNIVLTVPSGAAFTDNFNRANGAIGNGWVDRAGFTACTVASNRAVAPSGTESQCYHPTDVGSEDMWTEADIHLGGTGDYPTVSVRNLTAARTIYFFYHEPGGTNQFTISKLIGGSFFTISTQTGPTVGSAPCDYTLRLEAQGTTLRGYVNGTLAVTTTDSSITTSQRYGGFTFYNGSGNSYIDNWETGAL